jgi:RHS repeat-associated protein
MYAMLRKAIPAFVLLLSTSSVLGQVQAGTYPYGTFDNNGFDIVNVGNLNVHFSIPVLNKAGRGLPFYYNLSFDNSVWYPATVNGSTSWTPVQSFGWSGDTEVTTGYVSTFQTITNRSSDHCTTIITGGFVYTDPFGVQHPFGGGTIHQINYGGTCTEPSTSSFTSIAEDGSGYTISVTDYAAVSISSASGKQISPPVNIGSGSASVTDSNGNQVSVDGDGHFTDTTGNVVLTVAGSSPNPHTFTYKDTSGNPQSVSMAYKTYTVQTAFGCSGVGEYGPTSTSLVDSITFPDGSAYHFTYEATPGASANVTGRLASVELPQGGSIGYTYSGGSNGIVCADGSTAGLTRSIASTSGSAASTATYARTVGTETSHTEAVDGLSNHKAYDFVEVSNQPTGVGITAAFYETNRSVYQGAESGTPVVSRQTCYNGAASPCTTTIPTIPFSQIDTYETLNGVQEHGSTAKYNTYGLQTEEDDYDFGGASARGSLLRKELWAYPTSGIVSLVLGDTVYDGGGNIQSQSVYGYDQTTPVTSSGVPQHAAMNGPRGNLTSVQNFAKSSTPVVTNLTYEDTGSILTSNVQNIGASATTTYSYDSAFVYNTGTVLPTPSSGVAMSTSGTYDQTNTGLPLTSTDVNGQTTTTESYDSMLRPTEIDYPNGEKVNVVYRSANQTGVFQTMNSAMSMETETLYDAYGRTSRVAVANGSTSNPWYQTDYCYNAAGQLQFQPTQYAGVGWGTPEQCSGAGDTYSYDALGRVTNIAHADGSSDSSTYNGRTTLRSSSSGASRMIQSDGLGRTTAVCEISSNASMPSSGAPSSCGMDIAGTGFLTTYTYDLGNHRTTVTQGAQTRVFQTDWLGRTILVQEPESGQTTYSYAYNSTGLTVTRVRPQANQTNSGVQTTTTTQYDSLSRPLNISYSDGTPEKIFYYDQATNWGPGSLGSSKGRLTLAMGNLGTGMQFAYDAMGNVTSTVQCLPDWCGIPAHDVLQEYSYYLTGQMSSEQYGNAEMNTVTLNYGENPAGQLISVTGGQNNATNSPTIFSASSLGPFGPILAQFGNGLQTPSQYDSEGRYTGGWVCVGTGQPGCGSGTQLYGFDIAMSGSRVTALSDTVLNRASFFGYDEFGRLSSVTPNQNQNALTMNFTYDRYGNRWSQSVSNGGTAEPQPNLNINVANNQVTSNSYDAAGNVIQDGVHSYQYDAENNLISVDNGSTATYVFDALNHRVKAVVNGITERYGFDTAGRRSTTWQDNSTNLTMAQYYAGSQPIAYWTASDGNIHFEHQDWLGTERLRTSFNGSVESSFTSLPFGDALTSSGADTDQNHFAMLDHDAETSSEHATFRQYSSTQGRWMRPDPYLGSYHLRNPQSMNRYAYVLNNPLSFTDPLGLELYDECVTDCDGSGGDGGDPGGWGGGGDPGGGGYGGDPGGGDPNNPGTCDGPYCTSVGGGVPYDPSYDPTDLGSCAFGCGTISPVQSAGGWAPSSAACPPNCGFTMQINVSTTVQTATAPASPCTVNPATCAASDSVLEDILAGLLNDLGPLIFLQGDNKPSSRWSKFPGCSVQHENDIAICQQRRTTSCWNSANQRLAYCNATGGEVGIPTLSR